MTGRSSDPHPRPDRGNRRDEPTTWDDDDPTGVRAMLAALPDPGPMPADVVRRIHASLAAEQPVPSLSAGFPDQQRAGGEHALHERTAARRHSLSRRLPSFALAASLVILAGVVLLGALGSLGLGGGSDSDVAFDTLLSEDSADSGADASAQAEGGATLESAPEPADEDALTTLSAGIPMLASGALVTRTSVAGHARDVRDGAALDHDESAAEVLESSPMGTPAGAADCLGRLLDVPPAVAEERMAAVDVVRFEDAPAVLLLVRDSGGPEDPAARLTEATTAYLVRVDCGAADAAALLGPVRVDL